ncbi:MAG TPA: hypothetical protein VNA57_13555 [Acidimicrobiales bacterium]|nr:hypothetical protein [Acidimicrobiales bacterium]
MEDRKEQAVALRKDGMSRAQIAEAMGGVSNKMLTKWLKGIPPPEWTKRPRAKDHLRERAVAMRLEGGSYQEIKEVIGVSKGTLSLWLGDLALPEERRLEIGERRVVANQRRAAAVRSQRIRRAEAIVRKSRSDVPAVDDAALFVAGVVAYWAEGAKAKPWRSGASVIFTNSDPDLIVLFLRWLQMLGIGLERVTFRLCIHESADEVAALDHWSKVVDAPVDVFLRTTFKRHNPKTVRKNVGEAYHGCLAVRVRRSTDLNRQIEGWWKGIVEGIARDVSSAVSSSPSRSGIV